MEAKGRLLELDCLRGIAATIVVIFHFTLGQDFLNGYLSLGAMGVELFFIISGFVIFLTIEKTRNWKTFLLSRFARLYPAYWACVTLTTFYIIAWSLMVKAPIKFPGLTDYLVNLTMFQYYFNVKNIDGAYWTLIIELVFYFFILIVFLLKKLHRIEIIGFFIVLYCLAYATVLKAFAPYVCNITVILFPTVTYFPLFIAGIVFYKIKFYKFNTYRLLLVLFCLITQILLFKSTGREGLITQTEYAITMPVFFGLFFLYCFNRLGFIVNRVTLFIGKISYSLYLINGYFTLYILMPVLTHSRYFHLSYGVAILCIATPVTLITATLINRFIEIPAMRYLKGKQKTKSHIEETRV